jgi:hypothetical protein
VWGALTVGKNWSAGGGGGEHGVLVPKMVFLGNLFFGRELGVGNGGQRPSSPLDLDVYYTVYVG